MYPDALSKEWLNSKYDIDREDEKTKTHVHIEDNIDSISDIEEQPTVTIQLKRKSKEMDSNDITDTDKRHKPAAENTSIELCVFEPSTSSTTEINKEPATQEVNEQEEHSKTNYNNKAQPRLTSSRAARLLQNATQKT